MVDRLLQLKAWIVDMGNLGNKNLSLSSYQWTQAEELRDLLKKPYEVTKQFQQEDLTPGQFYRKWTALKLHLEATGGLIAMTILESMKKREKDLFEDPVVLAAIYMDVFNSHLFEDQLTTDKATEVSSSAKNMVIELALRLKGLEDEKHTAEDSGKKFFSSLCFFLLFSITNHHFF